MPKSYLITLSEAELQTVVFECVDRAIKINKYFSLSKEKSADNSKINIPVIKLRLSEVLF